MMTEKRMVTAMNKRMKRWKNLNQTNKKSQGPSDEGAFEIVNSE